MDDEPRLKDRQRLPVLEETLRQMEGESDIDPNIGSVNNQDNKAAEQND